MKGAYRRLGFGMAAAAAGVFLVAIPGARAAVYSYVDWTSANVAMGSANGVVTLPDSSTVSVTFEAISSDGAPGKLYGAQVDGGTNYWNPTTPYVSPQVENAPPTPDILQLQGGTNETYRVTLSEPIKDPIMALVSLGQRGLPTTYDFDAPFTIVSQGPGYFGGNDTALESLPGNVLQGSEGSGTIQFIGTFATFSWTVPTPETWHGFTFGIRTTERLEPTAQGGGGAGGVGGASAVGGAGGTVGGACAPPPCGMIPASGSAGKSGAGGTAGGGHGGSDGLAGAAGATPSAAAHEGGGCSCTMGTHGGRGRGDEALVLAVAGAVMMVARRRARSEKH